MGCTAAGAVEPIASSKHGLIDGKRRFGAQDAASIPVAHLPLPDNKWGERPLALVVAKAGHALSVKDLNHHVREYAETGVVNKQVVLMKVRLIAAIDRTSVGKINKVALREKYAG